MSDLGITLGYEKDTCSICKEPKEVRFIYDKKNYKIVAVCDACVKDLGTLTTQELLDRFGKKTDKRNIELLTKEQMEKAGFELTGKK